IFGSVNRGGGSVPDNGQVSFFGYLDDTDEEIRVETSVGAGYDAGNWFDDFQNYQTEAAGNPYDFHFFDLGQGEGFVLSGLIPNNSFHQENVTLGSVNWPEPPTILSHEFISGESVEIVWDDDPVTTVHVYRRTLPSEGSFFRLDDPVGSLANPGVAGDRFADASVDTAMSYQYLLIAEDAAAQLSRHSDIVTVSFEGNCCNLRGDIDHSGALPLDIGDLVALVDYMFTGGAEPVCLVEADVNGDGLPTIDIGDLVYLIDYMFLAGPLPPPCQ
ncbi:MAG: hypothetical protein OEV80_07055, partial [candidate division Zixibacteria bacterium]|nr:hypothetical protein [candidate division Zixibacteria bacterium]